MSKLFIAPTPTQWGLDPPGQTIYPWECMLGGGKGMLTKVKTPFLLSHLDKDLNSPFPGNRPCPSSPMPS